MKAVFTLFVGSLGLWLWCAPAQAAWPQSMDGAAEQLQRRLDAATAQRQAREAEITQLLATPAVSAAGVERLRTLRSEQARGEADIARQTRALQAVKAQAVKPGDPPPKAVVLQAAAQAQDKVDKLRSQFKSAYDRGDGSTAAALSTGPYERLGSGADQSAVGQAARAWADEARQLPGQIRQALSQAQAEADRLVEAALAFKACEDIDGTACADTRATALLDGVIAKTAFDEHHRVAGEKDKALSTATFGLEVIKSQPDIDPQNLPAALAFRRLLDSNADVQSYFGSDAVGVTAGAADANLSFRYVMNLDGKTLLNRRSRLSLIFSAPTNKDKSGVTRFIDSADALKNLASVKLAWQLTNAPFKLPAIGTLNDFGIAVAAAQDSRSHYTVDSSTPTLATEVKKNYTAVSLGLRWVFLMNPESDYKTLLVLGHDSQRSFKSGDVQTRCPTDPATATAGLVGCYTGTWGAPVRSTSRVVGIELRQHMPAFDIGLKLKQNLGNDKIDAELPLYLLRTHDGSAKKNPFSAGVVLSRSSGEPGLKWGLFVSLPLAFVRPER